MSHSIAESIFFSHAQYQETEFPIPPIDFFKDPTSFFYNPTLSLSYNEFKGITSFLQHDQEQSDAPTFPKVLLERISAITLSLNIKSLEILPKEEPHCNCAHCQIVRSMKNALEQNSPLFLDLDEEVSDEDLTFRSWIIESLGQHNYKLIHPDHKEEIYCVHLGSPLHCSCGSSSCEHIQNVLNS